MTKTLIANWKMQVGVRESVALARGTLLAMRGKKIIPQVVVCPPFPAFADVHKVASRSSLQIGAQNVFWEEAGAYTGEVSVRMLEELGITYALIGHSERREHVGETDVMVNKKVKAVLSHGLIPVVCVGESRQAREEGTSVDAVTYQVGAALEGVSLKKSAQLFIAYEPVWAISTSGGGEESPADAVRMSGIIRRVAAEHLGSDAPLSVLYGGSVDAKNAYAFLREDGIDGLLVGSASLKLSQFSEIILAAADVLEGKANV